jgi:hypothetical protein
LASVLPYDMPLQLDFQQSSFYLSLMSKEHLEYSFFSDE